MSSDDAVATSRNVDNALAFIDAMVHDDQAAAATLIGSTFSIANHAQGYVASTVDELIEAANGVASWTDKVFELRRVIESADGTAVVVQGRLSNTHTGGSWRGLKPTGVRVALDACYVVNFDTEGRIVSQDIYEDHLTVLEQIGAVQLVDQHEPDTLPT